LEAAQFAQNEVALDRSDYRFQNRGLEKPGLVPGPDADLADSLCWARLAGDGEDDDVAPFSVVGKRGDDRGRSALGSGLVGKGKGTRTSSPNSKAVIVGVCRVVPDLMERGFGDAGGS
jgi:hypothetical protein